MSLVISSGVKEDGVKSCGQAAYVIYNQSAESYLKFKQVETAEDFNKINNYEYRGGPPSLVFQLFFNRNYLKILTLHKCDFYTIKFIVTFFDQFKTKC